MGVRLGTTADTNKILADLLELPKTSFQPNGKESFEPSETVYVDMNCAGVTKPDSNYPALGTDSLSVCMGVIVHNTTTKATGLAHAGEDCEQEIRTMMRHVAEGGGDIQARLIGPRGHLANAPSVLLPILDILAEYEVDVLSADFGHKRGPSAVAVQADRWEEGVIRGRLSASEMIQMHADDNMEGWDQMVKEAVDFQGMVNHLPMTHDGLVYNGKNDQSYDPGHDQGLG